MSLQGAPLEKSDQPKQKTKVQFDPNNKSSTPSELRALVLEWANIRSETQRMNKRKKEIEPMIKNIMELKDIEEVDTPQGILKFAESKSKESVNEERLETSLKDFLKDNNRANEAVKYVMTHRKVVLKKNLKFVER